jgi:Tfp pilus assembly protein PilN
VRRGPFRINLSSSYRAYVAPVRIGLLLLSLLLFGLIAWDYQYAKAIRAQAAEVEEAVARVRDNDRRVQGQAQAEGLDVSDAALQKLPNEVAFANQLIDKRAFSWTHLLKDLEEAVPDRIAIQSVRLDFKTLMISLSGSAESLKDLTAFIISLERHPAFKDTVLTNHNETDKGLFAFNLTVRYASSSMSAPARTK